MSSQNLSYFTGPFVSIRSEQYNDLGDAALAVLGHLGLTSILKPSFIELLGARLQLRKDLSLIQSARNQCDQTIGDIVLQHWLLPLDAMQPDDSLWSIAVRVLSDIADCHSADQFMQDKIWTDVEALLKTHPAFMVSPILLGSDMAPRCNSSAVIRTMLEYLDGNIGDLKIGPYQRRLIYIRVSECIRPNQLMGWKISDLSSLSLLRSDACGDTKQHVVAATHESLNKETAWDCLLRLGDRRSLEWFEEAVAQESNDHVRRSLCETFACFKLDPLPPSVSDWLQQPYDYKSSEEMSDWATRMGAISVARSAATQQAFDTLLNFGFTFEGKVLQQTVDALSEVAYVLSRSGINVIDPLISAALHGQELRHRTSAVGALSMLSRSGILPKDDSAKLIALIDDSGLDLYARSLILGILSRNRNVELQLETVTKIRTWAQSPDNWLGGAALEYLVRHNLLDEADPLIQDQLCLKNREGQWEIVPGRKPTRWTGYIVGRLYEEQPSRYSSAAVAYLITQNWDVAFPLLQALVDLHHDANKPVPDSIRSALIKRIRTRHTNVAAEPDTIRILGRLAPDDLVLSLGDELWSTWMPEAKAVLGDTLAKSKYRRPETVGIAVQQLLMLAKDGQFRVRRAAYRALVYLSPVALYTLCTSLSRASSVELRERAAEACAWLGNDNLAQGLFAELSQVIAADPEFKVRQTMEHSLDDRRERFWAQEYLLKIRQATGESNQEILNSWRYGQALVRVGDDSIMSELQTHLSNPALTPNAKHWVRQIIQNLDTEWKSKTQKWPEPWLRFDGSIEETSGSIRSYGRVVEDVRFSLWQVAAASPTEKSSWGGAAWLEGQEWVTRFLGNAVNIEVADGRVGAAQVSSYSGNLLIFLGQEQFPKSNIE